MNDGLRPGWRRWRFEEIATNVNVRVDDPSEAGVEYYVGLEHLDSDSLKILRWGSPEDVRATKLLFEPGDIIFGRRRAYQRKLGVAEWRGIASAHSLVLRAKSDVVLQEFLPFFMQSNLFMARAQEISVGSLSPTINWKTLAKQEFALPPLAEQRRYVCLLRSALETYQCVIDCAAAHERLLQSFCADVKGRNDCAATKIGQIAKFTSGKTMRVTSLPQQHSLSHPFPVYGGNGISGWSDKYLENLPNSFPVLGRVGQYCGVAHLAQSPSWITDNALYPRSNSPAILPEYLMICLKGARLNMSKLGEYLPLITQKVVHDTLIPLPDIDKQREFVSVFEEITSTGGLVNDRRRGASQYVQDLSSLLMGARS